MWSRQTKRHQSNLRPILMRAAAFIWWSESKLGILNSYNEHGGCQSHGWRNHHFIGNNRIIDIIQTVWPEVLTWLSRTSQLKSFLFLALNEHTASDTLCPVSRWCPWRLCPRLLWLAEMTTDGSLACWTTWTWRVPAFHCRLYHEPKESFLLCLSPLLWVLPTGGRISYALLYFQNLPLGEALSRKCTQYISFTPT